MIEEGRKAPTFHLLNQDGKEISLTDFAGKHVALYFYPKDDTPGCTVEGQQFSALHDDFAKKNTVVFGVSKDSVESHKKFHEKYAFKIDLLSDEEGKMLEAYDAWREKNNYGKTYMGIVRSTVLINPNGKIQKHWRNVKADGHAEKVLAEVVDEHA